MKMSNAMIAWTPSYYDRPTDGQVEVGPWPDDTGWSDKYARTVGACNLGRSRLSKGERLALVFIDFNTLVVRDEIDPLVAHKAFLAIDEYRTHISSDTAGAT